MKILAALTLKNINLSFDAVDFFKEIESSSGHGVKDVYILRPDNHIVVSGSTFSLSDLVDPTLTLAQAVADIYHDIIETDPKWISCKNGNPLIRDVTDMPKHAKDEFYQIRLPVVRLLKTPGLVNEFVKAGYDSIELTLGGERFIVVLNESIVE